MNAILISVISYYTFIACWWGKYENWFTQEYHIPRGQCPKWIWYSWVNTFSYFLYPHAIPIYFTEWNQEHTYMYNTAGKHILSPLERCLGYLKTTCKRCVPIASDVYLSKNASSEGKTREASEGVEYDFYFTNMIFVLCSDFYPLSNQINLFMVINIWGIIQSYILGYIIY